MQSLSTGSTGELKQSAVLALAESQQPVKKRWPWWVKLLIAVLALVMVGLAAYIGMVIMLVTTLGNAGTEYNNVLAQESNRIKNSLAVTDCRQMEGGEISHGNLDAIEKYRYVFSCTPLPAQLEQLAGNKLTDLGYTSYQGIAGIYRNDCCEIQYQPTTDGYSVALYSNKVSGRE